MVGTACTFDLNVVDEGKPISRAVVVFAVAVLLSLSLVLMGDYFAGATQDVGFNIDSYAYTRATIYGPSVAFTPYKYRVLVPFAAHQIMNMGVEPYESLKVISFVSSFLFYVAVFLICLKLTSSMVASSVGLVAIYSTYVHHHWSYRMVAMIDATVLLVIALMVLALLHRNFWAFLILAVLGAMVHEFTIFLTPAWFVRRRWIEAGAVIAVPVGIYILTKKIIGAPADEYWHLGDIGTAFKRYGLPRLVEPGLWLKNLLLVWGVAWPVAILGLVRSRNLAITACFITAGVGALVSMMFAETHDRLLFYLSPIMAAGIAVAVNNQEVNHGRSSLSINVR